MEKLSMWIAITVGSAIGGYLPTLWGGGLMSSMLFSTIGAILAIWANFRLTH